MSAIHALPNWGLLLALLISITSIAFATLSTTTSDSDPHPLLSHLSPNARLLLPSTPEYTTFLSPTNNETERWSTSPLNSPPPPSLIVIPTTESDISAAIRYANSHALPFLATTGGHGTTTWLATMPRDGVVIYMREMARFELLPSHGSNRNRDDGDGDGDGGDDHEGGQQTAIIGGGLLAEEVIDKLWAAGLQTTTGVCGCVSFSGPALGGGHGLLQGRYGLVADQVVSARVVLGDGEVVEVAGEGEMEDLFWGLRGAGHNFGVVSEWRVRVHPVEEERRGWAWEMFVFGGERLEELYGLVNGLMDDQPEELIFWSFWVKDLEIDPVEVGDFVGFEGEGMLTCNSP